MWEVSKNYYGEYFAYCLFDNKLANNSSNRDYDDRTYATAEEAQARADELNKIKNSLHSCCITVQASKPRLTKYHTISIAS